MLQSELSEIVIVYVPFCILFTVAPVMPIDDQVYVYGIVPPETVTNAVPPTSGQAGKEPDVAISDALLFTKIVVVIVHPDPSTTVTV